MFCCQPVDTLIPVAIVDFATVPIDVASLLLLLQLMLLACAIVVVVAIVVAIVVVIAINVVVDVKPF